MKTATAFFAGAILAGAIGLCAVLALPAQAGVIEGSQNEDVAPKLVNMTREQLLAYHSDLEKKLQTRDYRHIKDDERAEIAAAQGRIRAVLDRVSNLEQLKEDQRLTLFNEHQRITALIESREKDRVICKRVQLLGTHRTALECLTVAELDKLREMSHTQMREVQKGPMSHPQ